MAKITAKVGTVTDKDGNAFDPTVRPATSGGSQHFQLIPSGYSLAVVNGMVLGSYEGKANGVKGKVTYWKVTPDITLMNGNKTIINRQEITLGAVKNGALYRPDKDSGKPAIWALAKYCLSTLGLLENAVNDDGEVIEGEFVLDFDTDAIMNRVVKVRVGIGGYIKGEQTFDEKAMTELLLEQNDGNDYTFEEIPALVAQYNEDHEYPTNEGLKTKNIITNFFNVDMATIEEHGFYLEPDTGAVFTNEAAYDSYLSLRDSQDSYVEPSDLF